MYCGRVDVAAPMTSCDRVAAVCAIKVVAAALPVPPSSDSASRRERVFGADIVTPPKCEHRTSRHADRFGSACSDWARRQVDLVALLRKRTWANSPRCVCFVPIATERNAAKKSLLDPSARPAISLNGTLWNIRPGSMSRLRGRPRGLWCCRMGELRHRYGCRH